RPVGLGVQLRRSAPWSHLNKAQGHASLSASASNTRSRRKYGSERRSERDPIRGAASIVSIETPDHGRHLRGAESRASDEVSQNREVDPAEIAKCQRLRAGADE